MVTQHLAGGHALYVSFESHGTVEISLVEYRNLDLKKAELLLSVVFSLASATSGCGTRRFGGSGLVCLRRHSSKPLPQCTATTSRSTDSQGNIKLLLASYCRDRAGASRCGRAVCMIASSFLRRCVSYIEAANTYLEGSFPVDAEVIRARHAFTSLEELTWIWAAAGMD